MDQNNQDYSEIEEENEDATAKRTLPKVLSYDEIDRLLLAIRDFKDMICVCLMLFAGLRVSEATNLLVKDVDSERGGIFVRQGKGGKDRWAPCDPRTIGMIKCYVNSMGLQEDQGIFVWTTRTARRHLEEVYKSAGITWGPTCHTLRHTCATWQLDMGIPLEVVRENLGHEDISTTQIYLHLNIRQRSRIYREAARFL